MAQTQFISLQLACLCQLEVGCTGSCAVAKGSLRQVCHRQRVGQPAPRVLCCRGLHVLHAHLCTQESHQNELKGMGT